MDLTVADAAARLGVSPRRVRALVEAGRLPARRVGTAWVTTPGAVDAYARTAPGRGRPLSPATAWARLAEIAASSRRPDPDITLRALRARSTQRVFDVDGPLLDQISRAPGIVAGGAAAAEVDAVDRIVDLYGTAATVDRLIERLGLVEDPAGRLALHTVALDEVPELTDRERLVLAWCDLAARADPAADVAVEALWPGTIAPERLADIDCDSGEVPFAHLRGVLDWVARHPHLATAAIADPPKRCLSPAVASLVAGIAETVADDHGVPIPAWAVEVPAFSGDLAGTIGPTHPSWSEVPPRLAERGIGLVRDTFWRPR